MLSNPVLCYAAASVMGAIFVFPGVRQLKVGGTNSEPPYLTGIGAVFIGLMLAPILTICGAVLTYLGTRKTILRSEDPFHKALWVCTCHICHVFLLTCTRALSSRLHAVVVHHTMVSALLQSLLTQRVSVTLCLRLNPAMLLRGRMSQPYRSAHLHDFTASHQFVVSHGPGAFHDPENSSIHWRVVLCNVIVSYIESQPPALLVTLPT